MDNQVLCTLRGPMAVENAKTRNFTNYGSKVWDYIFNSPEYKEMEINKSHYIGLDHPEKATRSNICTLLREVAGIVRNIVRKPNGEVEVEVDILDTPFGRIAYTLARYGSFLGISTRMNGDVDEYGNVIPETVEYLGADLVSVPSQEMGRLKMVLNESVGTKSILPKAYLSETLKYVKNHQPSNGRLIESLNNSIKEDNGMSRKVKVPLMEGKGVNPRAFGNGLFESKSHMVTEDGMLRNLRTGRDSVIKQIVKKSENLLEMYDTTGAMAIFEMVDAVPEEGVLLLDEFGNPIVEGCDNGYEDDLTEKKRGRCESFEGDRTEEEIDMEDVLTESQFTEETKELVDQALDINVPEIGNVVIGEDEQILVESKAGIRVSVLGRHGAMKVHDASGKLLEIAKMEKGDGLLESVKTLMTHHGKGLLEGKKNSRRSEGLLEGLNFKKDPGYSGLPTAYVDEKVIIIDAPQKTIAIEVGYEGQDGVFIEVPFVDGLNPQMQSENIAKVIGPSGYKTTKQVYDALINSGMKATLIK